MTKEPEITPFNYAASTFGNAYWSAITYENVWDGISMSSSFEEFDASILAIDRLNEIVREHYGKPKPY